MSIARLFVTDRLKAGTMAFAGAEFHHMVRVTRHQVNDTVRLFDGTGREADAEITFISRHSATLKVGKVDTVPEEEGPRIILAAAMPKSSRAGWLIEKSVEHGLERVIPISTSRGVVDPRHTRLDNLRANIIAPSKQCGRSRLMEIGDLISWQEFVASDLVSASTAVAHPGGMPFTESLVHTMLDEGEPFAVERRQEPRPTIVVAVGPEGGFTVEEITHAVTRGARLVSLGPRILRVETAGIMAASIFQAAKQTLPAIT